MTARFRSKNIASSLAGTVTALALASSAVPCAAQAQAQPVRPNTGAARTAAPAPAKTPAVMAAPGLNIPPEYIIGADDVLSVIFWKDKELTADVNVRPDGKISLPLLNEVQAAGLTPAQLKDRIVDEGKKYVEDPNVTIVVKVINSRKVFITGEVRKPGPYPLTGATTVLQLISIAGGLADYAKTDKITI